MPKTSLLFVFAGLLAAIPFPSTPSESVVSLDQAWSTPLGQLRQTSLVRADVVGDVLLVEDARHGLTALELDTGHPRWFVQMSGALDHWPSMGTNTVCLASGTRSVVVELSTGHRLFERGSPALPAGSPVSDGRLMYVPSLLDDTLYAIDMQSGLQAWEYRLPARFAASVQLIGPEGRRSVLIVSDDGLLRALPASADIPRRERWVRHVGELLAPPVISGDRIYVATVGRELIALNAGSGEIEWKYLPGEALVSGALIVNGRVVLATRTRVICLNAEDGAPNWEVPAEGVPMGSAGGALLVRDRAGSGELLDIATGKRMKLRLPLDAQSGGGLLLALDRSKEVTAWRVAR